MERRRRTRRRRRQRKGRQRKKQRRKRKKSRGLQDHGTRKKGLGDGERKKPMTKDHGDRGHDESETRRRRRTSAIEALGAGIQLTIPAESVEGKRLLPRNVSTMR